MLKGSLLASRKAPEVNHYLGPAEGERSSLWGWGLVAV